MSVAGTTDAVVRIAPDWDTNGRTAFGVSGTAILTPAETSSCREICCAECPRFFGKPVPNAPTGAIGLAFKFLVCANIAPGAGARGTFGEFVPTVGTGTATTDMLMLDVHTAHASTNEGGFDKPAPALITGTVEAEDLAGNTTAGEPMLNARVANVSAGTGRSVKSVPALLAETAATVDLLHAVREHVREPTEGPDRHAWLAT